MLTSEKISCDTKSRIGENTRYCVVINGSTQQEDIELANIYALKIEAPKRIKQISTDLKGKVDSITIIEGDLNPHLHQCTTDRKSVKKLWP